MSSRAAKPNSTLKFVDTEETPELQEGHVETVNLIRVTHDQYSAYRGCFHDSEYNFSMSRTLAKSLQRNFDLLRKCDHLSRVAPRRLALMFQLDKHQDEAFSERRKRPDNRSGFRTSWCSLCICSVICLAITLVPLLFDSRSDSNVLRCWSS